MAPIGDPTNARSRRTRAALLDAARSVLESDGFDALTMAKVAEEAGVTRRAVYLHFESRADLVTGLFEHVAATERLHESLRPVWDAPDAVAALAEWGRHLARYHPRLMAIDRAVERVRRVDPDAARHRERVVRGQRAGCRRLATWLEQEGRLREGWTVDTATDMLWSLISTEVIERLLVDRRWSRQHLGDALGRMFVATFADTKL